MATRRTLLRTIGALTVVGGAGVAGARAPPTKGRIRKMGHSLLSDPPGGYAEEDLRSDGQYAVLGSFLGEGGSFLVDVSNPTDPTEVHRLPSDSSVRNADVAFDPRDGLYYRVQEPNSGDAEFAGVEVVDYGFDAGTAEDPEVVASIESGPTHNVFPHPEAPLLYAVNEHNGTEGLEIWDVSDPAAPTHVDTVGPVGGLHDVVVDPEQELAHGAYISDVLGDYDPGRDFAGYLIWDVSDPRAPSEVGRFDYEDAPDYAETGEEGFEACHYADYDPERGLAYVGDEKGGGIPGGKHVFDVGWGEGSTADPVPIGFTTSPNAEPMDDEGEAFDWTTHNHDVIPKGSTTLLVSGDYHEGTVVYDVTDPTDPTPSDQYRTDDGADDANGPFFPVGEAPMAWGANYSSERDLVITSDMVTGVYTFKVTPAASGGDGQGGGHGN